MKQGGVNTSLDSLLRSGLTRFTAAVLLSLATLLTAQAFLFSYQAQNAVCEVMKAKFSQFIGPLGREIALGDIRVAKEIFSELKQAVKSLKAAEDLQLDFVTDGKNTDLGNNTCQMSFAFSKINQPIYFGDKKVASIRGKVSYFPAWELISFLVFLAVSIIFAIRSWNSRIVKLLHRQIIEPITTLSKGEQPENLSKLSEDVRRVAFNIGSLKARLLDEQRKNLDHEKKREMCDFAIQLAHDIRSPLALLNVLSDSDFDGLAGENKKMLRMISERVGKIASDLLLKFKGYNYSESHPRVNLVYSMLDKIVTEKRMLHRSKDLSIFLHAEKADAGVFTELDSVEFERAIANLVENAVEATEGLQGKVEVSLKADFEKKCIMVFVTDNGRGISQDTQETLGQMGATFGKSTGTGLGLYHARNLVERSGGNLFIRSKAKVGTTVEMVFPLAATPEWFTGGIIPGHGRNLVVVDDDPLIHDFWRKKPGTEKKFFFSISDSLLETVIDQSNFFLVDHRLAENNLTGIEFISKNGLSSRAILVSQDFESERLQQRCINLKCKMLPKVLLPFIECS